MTASRTIWIVALLVVVGGLASLGVTRRSTGTDAEPATNSAPDAAEPDSSRARTAPLPVEGIVVRRAPFVVTLRATGRAEAHRRAELALPVGGRIDAVRVREGDRVSRGAALVQLDPRPFEIARDEARAGLSNAETDYRLRLFADSSLTDERRERVEHRSGLTEARARLERAELDLEAARLLAPFAGEVADVDAVPGALARREEPVLTLVALDPIRIRADVLESDLGRVETGARAVVRFPAFGDEPFEGTVRALGAEVDASKGTGVAWIELPNPDGRIKPGMFADVVLAGAVHDDRLSVPREALLERDRRLMVFKAAGGRAEWQYVETGLETRERIEIVNGVAPGDTVLVAGHLTLAHAAPVKVRVGSD